jgi:predicted nucleotidyltransferase
VATAEDFSSAIGSALRCQPGVAAAFVFGSLARGEGTGLSDVDVALVVTGKGQMERAIVVRDVALALGRALPGRTFDVHALDELPTAIAGRVVTEGKLVFERDAAARVRAVVDARMAYHDFAWMERATLGEGLAGLRAGSMMVDAARLRALLSRLESRLRELQPYAATDVDAFIADLRRDRR